PTWSWDFIMHQAGTSVSAAGSSASTAITDPMGTSPIPWASMMIGMGHLRPSASIVTSGPSAGWPPGPGGTVIAAGAAGAAGDGEVAAGGEPALLRPNQRLLMNSHPRPH